MTAQMAQLTVKLEDQVQQTAFHALLEKFVLITILESLTVLQENTVQKDFGT